MSEERPRRDDGTFEKAVDSQEILKVFDRVDEPVLTATEIADELDTTAVTITRHLKEMKEDGLVDSKRTGARAVAWWAEVAPALSEETLEAVESVDRENAVPLEELDDELEA